LNPEPRSNETAPASRPDLSALRMDREELERVPSRRWIGWVVVLLVLGGAAAWAYLAPAPFLLPKVETTTVQVVTPTEASTVLTATGYTYARERAAVGSRVIGRVVDLRVDEGDRVKKGDVIAVLDSADLRATIDQNRASVAEAQANLADAERELARQDKLLKAGISTQSTYDAALTRKNVTVAQLGTAQARLKSFVAQLDYTVIRSPLDGVVIERNVLIGEMVAPGGFTSQQSTGAIVRIANPASLEVEADINESYIARLTIGQPAAIKIDAVPDRSYHGKLRQIVPTADRQKAVVKVKVTIEDADRRLVPDMSSTVTFLGTQLDRAALEAKPKLFVPREAVRKEGATSYVLVVRDGKLDRTEVTVREEPASATQGAEAKPLEVLSGLKGGETIVRAGIEKLKDGQKVRAEA
jgi:HlyD family secretion protein